MPVSEATGWGRLRLRVGGERFSRLRFWGKVSGEGAADRGTHFSRPHRQAPVGRYMNCQMRERLMLRPKLLRCHRTEAPASTYGAATPAASSLIVQPLDAGRPGRG